MALSRILIYLKIMNKKISFTFLLLSILFLAGMAQNKPVIGLALSGGGAKGLAHIGILKAIDSAGLKVDLITGTSMGSIVGGLYAAGYTADSIEQMARNIDWRVLLTNSVSMRSYTMEEKSEYGQYAIELTANKGKIALPTGFLESQELWLKLQELFFPVAYIKDFDNLPRRFRCIATDLATGEAVVLSKGDLVTAIRSSMAIPGVFSAVDMDGKRYVDGGVVRNFPVKDVIDMGATYAIGVSVSSPLRDVKELDNALKVLTQVVFLNENKDRIKESALCDLLIDVPMGDFSSGSFNRATEILDMGLEVGRKYYPYFKKLADSLNHQQNAAGLLAQPMRKELQLNNVTVSGLPPGGVESFFEQLNLEIPGKYEASEITGSLRNAFAYRMYKNITYTLQPDSDSGFTLACKTVSEPLAALKAGLHFNSLMGFSVVGNLTLRNFFSTSSRTLFSLNVGENFRGLAEHLQLFGYRNPWSNRTQFYAEFQDLPLIEDFKRLGGYTFRYFKIDNQFLNSARRRWSGGFGAKWEYVGFNPTIEQGDYFNGHNDFFTLYGITTYNSYDRPFFPPKGYKVDFSIGYVFGLNPKVDLFENGQDIGTIQENGIEYKNYLRTTLQAERILQLGSRWANVSFLQAGINFGPHQSLANNFFMGGSTSVMRNQITFSGLREADLASESVLAFKNGFRYNVLGDGYVTLHGNLMYYDFIEKSSITLTPSWIAGAGVTLGYNLPIGPFEYTIQYGGKGAGWSTYLNVGFPFRSH